MIKKILTSLCILLICGSCSRIFNADQNLQDDYNSMLLSLGYSEDNAKLIESFESENQALFSKEYNEELVKLISSKDFKEEDINEYISLGLDVDTYYYLKNNDMLSSEYLELLRYFKVDKYFILKNFKHYVQYKDKYPTIREVVEYVNTKAYKEGYKQYSMSDTTKGIYTIASKIYYLYHYVPDNLVDVEREYRKSVKSFSMVKEAYEAFKRMSDAATSKGLKVLATCAYRSYEDQKKIYEGYLKKDPQDFVDTYSSRPGFSDHQIGLSIDVWADNKTFEEFASTKENEWLKDNAYKYGFIMRYPMKKEYITGYMYESWHYRYVGLDAAKEIHNNNITFDEYYAYYVDNSNSSHILKDK